LTAFIAAAHTGATVGHATISGIAYTAFTATTADTITVDPRVTAKFYMQLNDNAVATPPDLTRDLTHDQLNRQDSQLGFLVCRLIGSRAVGVNGVSWVHSFQDSGALVADQDTTTTTTATLGGSPGWDPAFFVWSSGRPAGGYLAKRTLPAPYTGLATTGATDRSMSALTASVFQSTPALLSQDPNLRVVAGIGPSSIALDADHYHAGDPLLMGLVVIDLSDNHLLARNPSASPVAGLVDQNSTSAIVASFNQTTGQAEYYGADFAWHPFSGTTAYEWTLAESFAGSRVFVATIAAANTANIGTRNLFIVGKAKINATPYHGPNIAEVTAASNPHSGYSLDAVGLALTGGLTFK